MKLNQKDSSVSAKAASMNQNHGNHLITSTIMKKIYSIIAIITLCLCSCSKEENLKVKDDKPTVGTYHFCVRASVDPKTKGVTFDPGGTSVTSSFASTDKIYVYNQDKQAFAKYWDDGEGEFLAQAINPSAISGDGKSCTLTGVLTFYDDYDNPVSVEAGDKYSLFYQMNDPNYYEGPNYDYSYQKGSASSASKYDFAIADNVVMVLDGSTLTVPEGVSFSSVQSMFRQHLSFTKESVPVYPSSFDYLTLKTEKGTLIQYLFPLEDNPANKYNLGSFLIKNPAITDQDVFLSLAFYYPNDDSKNDNIIFEIIDNDGNLYTGSKSVPTGGFQNKKYYYGTMPLVWQYQMVRPTVTRSDGGDPDELEAKWDNNNRLYIYDFQDADPAEITISGNSSYCYFLFEYYAASVTLSGNGIVSNTTDQKNFIRGENDLNIILASDFTIVSPNRWYAIDSDETLKLSTTGSTQKLTVTTGADPTMNAPGLYGWNNYTSKDSPASALAADGFTVTRSDAINNGDGIYTWVYTVSPVTP